MTKGEMIPSFSNYAIIYKHYNFHSFLKPVSVDLQVEMKADVSFL
jgi:hypothetical protein